MIMRLCSLCCKSINTLSEWSRLQPLNTCSQSRRSFLPMPKSTHRHTVRGNPATANQRRRRRVYIKRFYSADGSSLNAPDSPSDNIQSTEDFFQNGKWDDIFWILNVDVFVAKVICVFVEDCSFTPQRKGEHN